jgi:Zn-dependent protease
VTSVPRASAEPALARVCDGCGTQLAPALLACPACRRLLHAAALRELAAAAEAAEARAELSTGAERWRDALALLPHDSAQHAAVQARLDDLLVRAEAAATGGAASAPAPAAPTARGAGRIAGGTAVAAGLALLWKLKFLLLWMLGKVKLLFLGFTKLGTLSTMLLSFGVYWTAWGWRFAAGFVLSIYVHEMGHVAALRSRGIPASAPMFVPGVGAFVRMRVAPRNPEEDAYIGLAGPLFGLGAALACRAVFAVTGAPIWAAVAWVGALVNLFNLIPVWQLDGARGFAPLSRGQRHVVVVALLAALAITGERLLLLVALAALWRSFAAAPERGDARTLAAFVALVLALAGLAALPVPPAV